MFRTIYGGILPLFDANDEGGAAPAPVETPKPDGIDNGVSYKDFFANAPIMKGADDEQVNQPEAESNAVASENAAESQVNQPSEESNGEQAAVTPVDLTKAAQIIIDGQTYSRSDIEQGLKDKANREKWVANLTNDSKLLSWLQRQPPEQQERFRAFATLHMTGKEKLPETFEAKPFEWDVKLKDQYGDEVDGKFAIQPGTDEYKLLQEHFYNQFKHEHAAVFNELQDHRETREQLENERKNLESTEANRQITDFLTSNNIDFPRDGDLLQNIERIVNDKYSPYREQAALLVSVAQYAQMNDIDNLNDAYNKMMGKQITQKQTAKTQTEKAKQNQTGVHQEKPGKSAPVKSAEDQWREDHYNNSPQTKLTRAYDQLFSGKV